MKHRHTNLLNVQMLCRCPTRTHRQHDRTQCLALLPPSPSKPSLPSSPSPSNLCWKVKEVGSEIGLGLASVRVVGFVEACRRIKKRRKIGDERKMVIGDEGKTATRRALTLEEEAFIKI